MAYADLDPALNSWLPLHGLHVFKVYREAEVRDIAIVDDQGDEYRIWIDPPPERGPIIIHASNARHSSVVFEANPAELVAVLERAYQQVEQWIREAGHTRTPAPSSWDPSVPRWEHQGCRECRNSILGGMKGSLTLLGNTQDGWATVHQCTQCNAYWEANLREAHVITQSQAEKELTAE